MVNAQELLQKLDKLISVMELKAAPSIWGHQNIANWLQLSLSTTERHVVTRQDFPTAIHPTGADNGMKRYFADDVIQWARLNKGTLPKRKAK